MAVFEAIITRFIDNWHDYPHNYDIFQYKKYRKQGMDEDRAFAMIASRKIERLLHSGRWNDGCMLLGQLVSKRKRENALTFALWIV